MGSRFVVVLPPIAQGFLSFLQGINPVEIQTLVSQHSIEALDISILHRSTRTNEVQSDSLPMGPGVEVSGRELNAVVQGHHVGLPSSAQDPLQEIR